LPLRISKKSSSLELFLSKLYYNFMTPKQFKEILKAELQPIIEATVKPILEEALKPIIQTQQKHSNLLEKYSRQLEDIIVELNEVHKLAEATSDVVMARYEKNKREIDEIKDHLGLPKLPYFGE
jgi:AmiR/NasT family two-component response regulator